MSWAKDEWKDGLSAFVLNKVTEIERQNERLLKENKQKQFQSESLEAALQKQKRLTDEAKSQNSVQKRELQTLSESCQELERSRQKAVHELQTKETLASCLEGQLSKTKQCLESEATKTAQLKSDLERSKSDHLDDIRKFEKQSADLSKLQEANTHLRRQVEGQTERIRCLEYQRKHSSSDEECGSARRHHSSSSQEEPDQNVQHQLSELQRKYTAEVALRQTAEQKLLTLSETNKSESNPQEVATGTLIDIFDSAPVSSNAVPTETNPAVERELFELKKQFAELKTLSANLELQLQSKEKEIANLTQGVKDKTAELAEIKTSLAQNEKGKTKLADELTQTTSQLDKVSSDKETLERKVKQLSQELECQRHNAEAIKLGMEEKMKEKDKQYREEISSQNQALVTLEGQFNEQKSKHDQEKRSLEAAQREVQVQLDKALHASQKYQQHLDDAKQQQQGRDQAIKNQEQTISDLNLRIKSLQQEKNQMLAEVDREITAKKKLQDQFNSVQNELQRKDNCIKAAEGKTSEKVLEAEKIRKQALCDVENLKSINTKLETSLADLKKQCEGASYNVEKKERDILDLKEKLEASENEINKLNREVSDHRQSVKQKEEQNVNLKQELKEAVQKTKAKTEELNESLKKGWEFEQKYETTVQQLSSAKLNCESLEKSMSELKAQQGNTQLMIEAKDREIEKIKQVLSEAEKLTKQHSSTHDNKVAELESKLQQEQHKYNILQQEHQQIQGELSESRKVESEFKYKLDESSLIIKEKESEISSKVKELEEGKKSARNDLNLLEERCQALKKEKEQEKSESAKMMQQKAEEFMSITTKLENTIVELSKVKENVVHHENVISSKEMERQKLEVAYKELCVKSQDNEKMLSNECAELKREQASLIEKERNIQSVLESMKRDSKALQVDYKKACDLADQKAAEYRSVVENLEASQKYSEGLDHRVKHAETEVEGLRKTVKELTSQNEALEQQLGLKEEELQSVQQEASETRLGLENQVGKLEEAMTGLNTKLTMTINEVSVKDKDMQALSAKEAKLQETLQDLQLELKNVSERFENSAELAARKEREASELFEELKETKKKASELEEQLDQIENRTNLAQSENQQLVAEREATFAQLQAKEQEISNIVVEMDKIQASCEKEVSELKEISRVLQGDNESLKEKCQQLETAFKGKENELQAMFSDFQGKEKSLVEASQILQAKELEISNLTEELSSYQLKCEELARCNSSSNCEIEAKSREIEKLQNVLENKSKDTETEVQDLNTQLSGLQEKFEQLLQSTAEKEIAFTEMKSSIAAKDQELVQLQNQCEQKNLAQEELTTKLAGVSSQLELLQKSYELKEEELRSDREALTEVQRTLDHNTSELASKNLEITEKLSKTNEKLEQLTVAFERKVQELEGVLLENNALGNKLKELRVKCDGLEALERYLQEEKETMFQKIEQSGTALENKDAELKEMREKLESVEKDSCNIFAKNSLEIEDLKVEVNKLNLKVEAADSLSESKDKQIEKLAENLDLLENEKQSLFSKQQQSQEVIDALKNEQESNVNKIEQLSDLLKAKETELLNSTSEAHELKLAVSSCGESSAVQISGLQEQLVTVKEQQEKTTGLLQSKEEECCYLKKNLAELEEETGKLNAQKELMQMDFEDKDELIESLQNQTEQLESALQEVKKKLSTEEEVSTTLEKENGALQTKMEMSQVELENKESKIDELNNMIQNLEVKLQKSMDLRSSHRVDAEELQMQNRELSESLVAKNEELEELRGTTRAECEQLQGIVQELRVTLRHKEEDGETAIKDMHALNAQIETIKLELERKDGLVEDLQDRAVNLETQVKNSGETISSLQSNIDQLTAKNQTLSNSLEAKELELEDLKNTSKISHEQAESLAADLNKKLCEAKEMYAAGSTEVDALRSQINITQMDLEDRDNQVKNLGEKVESLETQLMKSVESSNNFKASVEQLEEHNQKLVDSFQNKVRENEELEKTLRTTRETADGYTRELEAKFVKLENEKGEQFQAMALKLEQSQQSLKLALDRVEELRAAKCEQYDLMLYTEKEFAKARNDLESEIKNGKTQIREFAEKLAENVIEIDRISNENEHLQSKLENSEEEVTTLKEQLEVSSAKSREKLAELSSQLEVVQSELEKVKIEKNEMEDMFVHTKNTLLVSQQNVEMSALKINELECLKEKVKELDRSTSSYSDEIRQLEESKAELLSRLQDANKEHFDLKDQLKSHENMIACNVAKYKEDIAVSETKIRELEATNMEINEKLAKALECGELDNMNFNKQLEDLIAEKNLLVSAVDEKESQLTKLAQESKAESDLKSELSEKVAVLSERVQKLELDLQDAEAYKRELTSSLERVEAELLAVGEELTHKTVKIKEDEEQVHDLRSRVEELQKEVKNLEEEKSSCETKCTESENEIEVLSSGKSQLELALGQAKERIAALRENLEATSSDSRNNLAQLNCELENVATELERTKNEKKELEEVLNQTKDKLQVLQEKVDLNALEISELCCSQNKVKELNENASVYIAEIRELEDSKVEVLSKLEEANKKILDLKDELKSAVSLIECNTAKHQEEVDAYERKVQFLEETNVEINEKLAKSLDSREENSTEFRNQLENLIAEKNNLTATLDEKESQLTVLAQECKIDSDLKSELSEKVVVLSERAQKLELDLEDAEAHKRELTGSLERVKAELLAVGEEYTHKIEERDTQVHELQAKVEGLQNKIKDLELEIAQCKADCNNAENEVTTLKELTTAMESQREKHSSEMENIHQSVYERDRKIVSLETEISALNEDLGSEKMKLVDLKKKLDSVTEETTALREEKDTLRREIEEKCEELKNLQSNLDEKSEDFEALKTESIKIARQLDSLAAEHEECRQNTVSDNKLHDIQQQIMQLEHSLSMEKSSKAAVIAEIEAREQEWEEERRKLTSSKGDVSLSENSNQSEIAELRKQLEEMRAKVKERDGELKGLIKTKDCYVDKCSNLESRLQEEAKSLEQQCEDLKYQIKQKEEESFVFKETVKQKEAEVESLERKYEGAKEIELELRHHLGEVTQQLERVQEGNSDSSDDVQRLNTELAVLKKKCDEAEISLASSQEQLSNLQLELESKEQELEKEKKEIVEAAKEFAIQREKQFTEKNESLQQKLDQKEENIQSLDAELNQLRYSLKTVQNSKEKLLATFEEREREFDVEKAELLNGSYSRDMFKELEHSLKEERQRVIQLQEDLITVQAKLEEERQQKTGLQKQMELVEDGQKDDNIRDDEVGVLNLTVLSLRSDLERLQGTLQREKSNGKQLTEERNLLTKKLEVLNQELEKQRLASVESEEESSMLKEKLVGVQHEKEKQQEEFVNSETQEKIKLVEAERKLTILTEELKQELKLKMELIEKNQAFEEKWREELQSRTVAESSIDDLKKEKESMDRRCQKLKSENEHLQQQYKQYKKFVSKTIEDLEDVHRLKDKEIKEHKDKLVERDTKIEKIEEQHEIELESLKVELLTVEDKCAKLRVQNSKTSSELWNNEKNLLENQLQEMTTKYKQAKLKVEAFDKELSALRCQLSVLEKENCSLKEKLQNVGQVPPQGYSRKAENPGEVNNLQEKIKRAETERDGFKQLAEEKEDEADKAVASYRALIKKYQKLERTKDNLQSRLDFARQTIKSKEGSQSSEAPRVPAGKKSVTSPENRPVSGFIAQESMPNLVSPCTMVTNSLSNLEIKSQVPATPTSSRVTLSSGVATTEVASSAAVMGGESAGAQLAGAPVVDNGVSRGSACEIPKQRSGVTRKTGQTVSGLADTRFNKRRRLTSCGKSTPVSPPSAHKPEGLPDVVSKGFADIPDPPIRSPFILRRTTAPVSRTGVNTKTETSGTGVRTRSQLRQMPQRSGIPSFTASAATAKENPSGTRLPTHSSVPPSMPLSPRKTNLPMKTRRQSPKKSHIPHVGTSSRLQTTRSSRRTSLGKHATSGVAAGSSLRQPSKVAKPSTKTDMSEAQHNKESCKMQ